MSEYLEDFPNLQSGTQRQTLYADFGNFLPQGVTLVGTPTCVVSVVIGVDAAPQSRVLAGPTVGTAVQGSNVANAAIRMQFRGLQGVRYLLTWGCDRSDDDSVADYNQIYCEVPQ